MAPRADSEDARAHDHDRSNRTLAERLFGATLGALELFSVYLRASSASTGRSSTTARSRRTSSPSAQIAPRYAREWLEQQAVAGILETHDDRFSLPPEHARVLVHADDPAHVAPFAHMLVGIGGVLPRVGEAYRTGGGVPYVQYGYEFRHGQGHINRPVFVHDLPAGWIDALPDIRTRLENGGPYDLVLVLETLHDLPHPVETLQAVRAAPAPGGAALVVDERVAETFTAPGDEVERMMYGWSITHCLPTQLADQPSAALGTVLRPGTVRELATQAGFESVEILDVENDFFRLYRLG